MNRRFAMTILAGAFALGVTSGPANALQECTGENCTTITVGSGSAAPGGTVSVPIEFAQGPSDGNSGQGIDEIAAIAFTLGIPGTGTGSALQIECADDDANGIPDSIVPAETIANTFRVVVENATCTNRNRCLCPTEEDQIRDDFINIAVYGPKDLPDQGPVEIPVLPSGALLNVTLTVPAGTSSGEVPLTIFSEAANPTKPQYGAYFSQGDQAAVDQSADREADRSKVKVVKGTITVQAGCVGDCNGDGNVTVDELVKGVNIALGNQPLAQCPAFDRNQNGVVTVDELVASVGKALGGCQGA